MKRWYLAVALLFLLTSVVVACRVFSDTPQSTPGLAKASSPALQAVITPGSNPTVVDLVSQQDTLVSLYEKVNPGVVAVRVLTSDGGGQGSGFVVDEEGHIVTNYHVVENLTDLEIAFPSGLKTRGKVLGTDLDSDIAVVKVDVPREELHPLTLSDSDQVKVGQTVIAIGNPFGFNGTMTMGIVSGLGRTMQSLHEAPGGGIFSAGDIIQTDAAINPGNSGGPLLNLNGEVVGVNRAIFTTSFTSQGEPVNSGIGFAISINIVKKVLPSLISEGRYDYPYVGITSTDDLSLLQVEALDLPRSTGVYVNIVTDGSPADKAGIVGGSRPSSIPGLQSGGDLIIAIDGIEVQTFSDFLGYIIKNKSPGDTVLLTVLRGNEQIEISLTLESRPSP